MEVSQGSGEMSGIEEQDGIFDSMLCDWCIKTVIN